MILWRMTNVEKSFADNGDDLGFANLESFVSPGLKREFRICPTENHVANLTPFRLRRYFINNYSRFVAGRVLERNVNVATRFTRCAVSRCFVAVRFDDVA
jgi:hypothetical protein